MKFLKKFFNRLADTKSENERPKDQSIEIIRLSEEEKVEIRKEVLNKLDSHNLSGSGIGASQQVEIKKMHDVNSRNESNIDYGAEEKALNAAKDKLGSPFHYERKALSRNQDVLEGLRESEKMNLWIEEAVFYGKWADFEENELIPMRKKTKQQNNELLSISEKDKEEIKTEVKGISKEQHKFDKILLTNHQLCFFLSEQAYALLQAGDEDKALLIIERCIFELNTNEPLVFHMVPDIIDDKLQLEKILKHMKKFLRNSRKLNSPINKIEVKLKSGMSLNDFNLNQVAVFVKENPGINKTKLHSGLRRQFGWYHQEATDYIENAIELDMIEQKKNGRTYQHYIN